jgi:hypothetical protein
MSSPSILVHFLSRSTREKSPGVSLFNPIRKRQNCLKKLHRRTNIADHMSQSEISQSLSHLSNQDWGRPVAETSKDPKEFLQKHEILSMTVSSVNAIGKMLRFGCSLPRSRPALTGSHIRKRLDFPQANMNAHIDWSREVTISDKCRFNMRDDGRSIQAQRGGYTNDSFRGTGKFRDRFLISPGFGF